MSGVRIPVYHAGTGAEIDEQAVVDKSFVPRIIRLTLRSGAEYPDVRHAINGHERVDPLHHVVYDLSPAAQKRPRRAGWEVHHRNRRPFDNRQINLRLHTAADHKRLTLDEKQKVTRHKTADLLGWWRPHAPAPVTELPAGGQNQMTEEEMARRRRYLARRPWHAGLTDAEIQAEPHLEARLAHHRDLPELAQDETARVPPMAKQVKTRRSRMVTRVTRLGVWPGELATAMCFAENGGDRLRMAKCLGVAAEVIKAVLDRDAVKNALSMWTRYRRWPKPTPAERSPVTVRTRRTR